MPYTARITRLNPTCMILVMDQSGSMADPWGEDASQKKADKVADIINRFLQSLSIKCAREEGVRDYCHVACIGYGAQVGPAFLGVLAGRDLVPLSEIANNPARIEQRTKKVEDGTGGLVDTTVRFPIWFDPVANGGTPMCQAFNAVQTILTNWLSQHGTSFPPVVFNVTDGESTDGDPSPLVQGLRNLATSDGNVLLFNVHISAKKGQLVSFPSSYEDLVDDYAKLLFGMSDKLPDSLRAGASACGLNLAPDARGFVFNAGMEQVIQFLNVIGTAIDANLR